MPALIWPLPIWYWSSKKQQKPKSSEKNQSIPIVHLPDQTKLKCMLFIPSNFVLHARCTFNKQRVLANHVSNQLTTIDIPPMDSNCHCIFWVQNKVCLAMTMAVTHHSVLWIQSSNKLLTSTITEWSCTASTLAISLFYLEGLHTGFRA